MEGEEKGVERDKGIYICILQMRMLMGVLDYFFNSNLEKSRVLDSFFFSTFPMGVERPRKCVFLLSNCQTDENGKAVLPLHSKNIMCLGVDLITKT